MKGNVFGLAEFVMYKEGEDACEWELVEGSSVVMLLGYQKIFERLGRKNRRRNLGCVEAEDRKKALLIRGRYAKDTISNGYKFLTVSRDKTSRTGVVRSESSVGMKMGGLVGSRDLRTIIKMGTGAIKKDRGFGGWSVRENPVQEGSIGGKNVFGCDSSKEVFDGSSGLG